MFQENKRPLDLAGCPESGKDLDKESLISRGYWTGRTQDNPSFGEWE
jgi:hypothetical protein